MNRRQLITGLISLVAAPAIVRVSNIMPIKCYDDVLSNGIMTRFTPIGGPFSAEDTAKFYARLKLYMDEVVPGCNEPDILYIHASRD